MSEQPMFRPEARAYAAQRHAVTGIQRVSPRWATASFAILLASILATTVASALIRIDLRLTAEAVAVEEGIHAVFQTAASSPRDVLAPGAPVDFISKAGATTECRIVHLRQQEGNGQPIIAIRAECPEPGPAPGDRGQAVAIVGRASLLRTFLGV